MSMIGNFLAVSDQQLQELLADPERIEDVIDADHPDGRRLIDVDKAWHAIHFLLAGEPWEGSLPEAFIVSGDAIGDIDVGYGPARGFTAAQVKEIDTALQRIDVTTLLSRWDPAAMRAGEVYGVDPGSPEEEAGYVGDYYEALRAFVHDIAGANLAMLVYIN